MSRVKPLRTPGFGGAAAGALAAALWLLAAAGGPAAWADRFADIDARARTAPASCETSVDSLAAYLQQGTRDERERARAAFSWVAHKLAYNGSLRYERPEPQAVLEQRRAACLGYAVLFEALAEAMGLEVEIITGHGKGRGYAPGDGMSQAQEHAWNAVRTDGSWGLVDCTWGSGYVEQGGWFVRRFTDHYFLTPPEEFVWDHLPDDQQWQLLSQPVTKEDYLNRVNVKPPFFERDLRLLSHQTAWVEAGSSLWVRIGAPRDTAVTAALYQDGRQLGKQYTFTQREGDGFLVKAAFPSRGRYLLRVFARARDAVGEEYEGALNYGVEAGAGLGRGVGYPEAYESFLARECRLERPLGREIRAGAEVEFSLTAPGAEEVVVVRSDDVWWVLDREGERFSGEVLTEAGEVTVFAKYPGKRRHEGLLKYVAR